MRRVPVGDICRGAPPSPLRAARRQAQAFVFARVSCHSSEVTEGSHRTQYFALDNV